MAKYLVLYDSELTAMETMENASEEDIKENMARWIKWKEESEKKVKVDFGMPLQPIGRVTPGGLIDSDSNVSGHSFLEGTEEDVIKVLEEHPHLKRPGSTIELFEVLELPELQHSND
jgi:hypothetical protein